MLICAIRYHYDAVLHDVGYKKHRVIKDVGGNRLKRPFHRWTHWSYLYEKKNMRQWFVIEWKDDRY